MRLCEKCGERIPKGAATRPVVITAHRPIGEVTSLVHLVFEGEGQICDVCGLGFLGEALPTLIRLLDERYRQVEPRGPEVGETVGNA